MSRPPLARQSVIAPLSQRRHARPRLRVMSAMMPRSGASGKAFPSGAWERGKLRNDRGEGRCLSPIGLSRTQRRNDERRGHCPRCLLFVEGRGRAETGPNFGGRIVRGSECGVRQAGPTADGERFPTRRPRRGTALTPALSRCTGRGRRREGAILDFGLPILDWDSPRHCVPSRDRESSSKIQNLKFKMGLRDPTSDLWSRPHPENRPHPGPLPGYRARENGGRRLCGGPSWLHPLQAAGLAQSTLSRYSGRG
jgi:hypothetical protein